MGLIDLILIYFSDYYVLERNKKNRANYQKGTWG